MLAVHWPTKVLFPFMFLHIFWKETTLEVSLFTKLHNLIVKLGDEHKKQLPSYVTHCTIQESLACNATTTTSANNWEKKNTFSCYVGSTTGMVWRTARRKGKPWKKAWRRARATVEGKSVSGPRQSAKELLELLQLPASWSDLVQGLNLTRETNCRVSGMSLWYRLTIKPHQVSQNLSFSGEQSDRTDGKCMKTQATLCF